MIENPIPWPGGARCAVAFTFDMDEEREYLRRAIGSIVNATGSRPRGYRAPSYAFSRHTLDLLLEESFEYDASLLGHDIPYVLTNGTGRLIELPSDLTLDDWTQYVC